MSVIDSAKILDVQLVPMEAAVFINDRLMFSVDYYLWSKLNLPE